MAHLESVQLSPNPVNAGKQYQISVTISTWNYLVKNKKWSDVASKKWSEVNSQWIKHKSHSRKCLSE